jgi:hypothetical protein
LANFARRFISSQPLTLPLFEKAAQIASNRITEASQPESSDVPRLFRLILIFRVSPPTICACFSLSFTALNVDKVIKPKPPAPFCLLKSQP